MIQLGQRGLELGQRGVCRPLTPPYTLLHPTYFFRRR